MRSALPWTVRALSDCSSTFATKTVMRAPSASTLVGAAMMSRPTGALVDLDFGRLTSATSRATAFTHLGGERVERVRKQGHVLGDGWLRRRRLPHCTSRVFSAGEPARARAPRARAPFPPRCVHQASWSVVDGTQERARQMRTVRAVYATIRVSVCAVVRYRPRCSVRSKTPETIQF